MKILAIDSATLAAGIAVLDDNRVVVEGYLHTRKVHSERLLPMLEHWLREAELTLAEIDALAVTTGPGSFTGIRIGMATAKSLAQVMNKPLLGIPTLDALALNLAGSTGLIAPMLDARKGEVYTAFYCSLRSDLLCRLSPYVAVAPDRLGQWLRTGEWPRLATPVDICTSQAIPEATQTICEPAASIIVLGEGIAAAGEILRLELPHSLHFALPGQNCLRPVQVAFLGLCAIRSGCRCSPLETQPLYIRASEAERTKGVLV